MTHDTNRAGDARPAAVPVLFVSSHAALGGSELYLERLLAALGPAWSAAVIVLARGPHVDRLRRAGLSVEVLETGARVGVLTSALALRKRLRATSPAVVHANGLKAALVAALATRGAGPPMVWVKHDFSRDGALARFVGRRSSRIVGVSAAVTTTLGERLADRIRVISPAVPSPETDAEVARAKLCALAGADFADPIIVLVGRVADGKGHLDLVSALPAVREHQPTARAVLIGPDDADNGRYGRALRARIRELGLAESVAIVGPRDDAPALVAGADVVTVPSTRTRAGFGSEGFGLAAAEAMVAGTAVVAYAEGALPETLGECGALVPVGDVGALAGAITAVLGDTERRREMEACGRRRAIERYGVEAMAEAMKAVYAEAAARTEVPRSARG